jgi:tetratricopeptide (TPR) repeat protein
MNQPKVRIGRRGAERLQGGHLWIYRSDVEAAPPALVAGDVVALVDGRGRFLAKAFWSARSQIALRVVTRDEEPVDEAFFAARIATAIAMRERTFGDQAFLRLVHGEADLLPGLVVDRYGDAAVMQTLVPATDRRKALLADLLANALSLRTVVERNDVRVRELEGLTQMKGVLRGEAPGPSEYREGEVRLALDVLGGQKTGAFLDQRENHLRAGEYAKGRCLDAFSYAGGFALQLARRAEHVTAVEMQAPAVALLRGNAGLNGAAAAGIARAANVEAPQVASAPRVDPELYDELLRAQYLANQLTPESLERSLALYREIVTRDPSNAAAWAGMAIDYGLLGFFTLPPPEASRLAEESARKALALDDGRAEAHASLGFVLHFYQWRWNEAESEYRRALDLNPNDASSHHRLWALLAMLGRWDEAESELETAYQLDPLSISIATNVGQNAGLRGDSERAIRQLEHALRLEPDYAVAQSHLWWVQHALGREKESGELLVRWLAGFGLEQASADARTELESGNYRSALRRAAQIAAEEASRKETMAYTIAQMFAASGQNDEAIAWLRRGFTDHGPELPWIAVDRAFVPLHERAEYKELLGAMHLTVSDGRRRPDRR